MLHNYVEHNVYNEGEPRIIVNRNQTLKTERGQRMLSLFGLEECGLQCILA